MFETKLRAILKEETEKIMAAHIEGLDELANEQAEGRIRKAEVRMERWQNAAEMSDKDNKKLRTKVQDLSNQLDNAIGEKGSFEGRLRKAEEKIRVLAKEKRAAGDKLDRLIAEAEAKLAKQEAKEEA